MNFSGNQKGFSLIEALMVLGITSIIGMAVMQTMRDSTNQMALSEAKFDELDLIRQVQTNLVYKVTCENNFVDKSLTNLMASNLDEVVNVNGTALFKVGQTVGNRSLKIKKFEVGIKEAVLADYNKRMTDPWNPGDTYLVDVELKVTTEKLKTTLGGQEMTRAVPLKVKINAANNILECFSSTDAGGTTAMSDFCAQMGGVYNTTTSVCDFSTIDCAAATGSQLVPSKCVDEKIAALKKEMDALTRTVASVPAATPAAVDPYKLPFSPSSPGPGCKGMGCAASDFGPCEGVSCTTNGGQCTGVACRTGVVTGLVVYDGTNMYTPANPGPGCSGMGCHASDYGPCAGVSCTTNGGSCNGTSCRTGVTR